MYVAGSMIPPSAIRKAESLPELLSKTFQTTGYAHCVE